MAETGLQKTLGKTVLRCTLAMHLDFDRMMVSLDETRYLDTAKSDPDGFIDSLPQHVTHKEIQRAT